MQERQEGLPLEEEESKLEEPLLEEPLLEEELLEEDKMPSNKIHCAISMKRTGKTFQELHYWIDGNGADKSVNHRNKRHGYTEELRRYVHNKFGGDKAVSEWLFHIALDNLDTSVTNDWRNNVSDSNLHVFGFCKNGFIHYEEQIMDEEGLEETFDEGED